MIFLFPLMEIELLLQNYQQQVAVLKKTVDKQSEKRSTLYYIYKDSNFR
jgi:hypothetical protein